MIHDEDEGEDWDERDKAKIWKEQAILETHCRCQAMKEKMDKMQLAFRKDLGMDDCFYNMGGVGSKTPIALPQSLRFLMWKKLIGLEILSNILGDI